VQRLEEVVGLGVARAGLRELAQGVLDLRLALKLGRGRARRWLTPTVPGFTTNLLLPAALRSL